MAVRLWTLTLVLTAFTTTQVSVTADDAAPVTFPGKQTD
jgi:hypothetical protein